MTLKLGFWGFYLLFTNVVIILSLYFLDEFNNSNDFVNEIKSATWMAIFFYIVIQTLFLINDFNFKFFSFFIVCLTLLYIIYQEK